MNIKTKLTILTAILFGVFFALTIAGTQQQAIAAAQYDTAFPVRTGTGLVTTSTSGTTATTSTSTAMNLPGLGSQGTWQTAQTGTYSGGVAESSGSGMTVFPGLLLTSTATVQASAILTTGTYPVSGILCYSGTLMYITGTNGAAAGSAGSGTFTPVL